MANAACEGFWINSCKGIDFEHWIRGPFVCIGASVTVCSWISHFPAYESFEAKCYAAQGFAGRSCGSRGGCAFGAPIGGVLFSIEVTSTYFMVSAYWKGFFCAVCGAIVFKQLGVFSHGRDNAVSLFTTSFEPLPYNIFEFLPFMILSALCGILAGVYVRFQANLLRMYNANFPITQTTSTIIPRLMIPGLLVVMVSSMIEYPIGSFMTLGLRHSIDDLFHEVNLD